MGTVTVGGSQYSNGGEKQFKEDVVLQLGANANKIKDLNVITDDLINEGLNFKDWPALVQEVHIRNVGYQAASVMEALMKEHTDRYKKAQDAIKAFNKEADETWMKEAQLEPSKRVKYRDSGDVAKAKLFFADEAMEKADVITWGPASFTDNTTLSYRPMFQWMISAVKDREPRKMNCWEAVLYSLVKTQLVPPEYIAFSNAPSRAKHGDYADDPMYAGSFPSRMQSGLLTAMDYFFWAYDPDEPDKNPCYIRSATPVAYQGRKVPTRGCAWIPSDWIIPRGRVLLFGMGDHVALSTGKLTEIQNRAARQQFNMTLGHGMLELDASTGTIIETTIQDLYADRPTYLRGIVVAPFPIYDELLKQTFKVPGRLSPDQEKEIARLRLTLEQEYQAYYAKKSAQVKANHQERIQKHETRLRQLRSDLDRMQEGVEGKAEKQNAINLEQSALTQATAREAGDLRAVEREKQEEIEKELNKLIVEALDIKKYPLKDVRVDVNVRRIDPYKSQVKFRDPTPSRPTDAAAVK
ncbi:hypothetical protein [Pyxidicoccus trucidator]|uniref:hypothetical protein n=1 Tax=Pyxidicoccus trucidator TaxID=2709662 RepID=UPI0019670FCA|nr:hypothetical protein [Pyxidicoccus trucidator]